MAAGVLASIADEYVRHVNVDENARHRVPSQHQLIEGVGRRFEAADGNREHGAFVTASRPPAQAPWSMAFAPSPRDLRVDPAAVRRPPLRGESHAPCTSTSTNIALSWIVAHRLGAFTRPWCSLNSLVSDSRLSFSVPAKRAEYMVSSVWPTTDQKSAGAACMERRTAASVSASSAVTPCVPASRASCAAIQFIAG